MISGRLVGVTGGAVGSDGDSGGIAVLAAGAAGAVEQAVSAKAKTNPATMTMAKFFTNKSIAV